MPRVERAHEAAQCHLDGEDDGARDLDGGHLRRVLEVGDRVDEKVNDLSAWEEGGGRREVGGGEGAGERERERWEASRSVCASRQRAAAAAAAARVVRVAECIFTEATMVRMRRTT